MNNPSALETLFHAQTIAVVGVSRDTEGVGSTIYKNIVEDGYKGTVFPVNPFIQTFQGAQSYPSVLSIPQTIDIAIVVVPAAIVPSVVEEVGKKGIPFAIIISSGFGEIGAKGLVLEKKIQEIAKKYQVSLLGPNCLGIIHPNEHLNASFARTKPLPGSIAFLSQSGALGTALLDIMTPKGIGFSHFISLGNKTDITELDILEYLIKDSFTSVIGMYVEQLSDAGRCIDIGRKIARMDKPKPIIVLKGGKTEEGNSAVRSHTGALAGVPEAYSALFQQSMMIEAKSTQEFINTLVSFSQNPLPLENTCVVITNAGGPAILATDTLISQGISVPPIISLHNPIDLLGDARATDYQKILATLEDNPTVGSIMGIVTPQTVTEIDKTANAFCMHKKTSTKPLAVCWMGDGVMREGRQLLDMGKIPGSKYPEQTATMLSNLHTFAGMKKQLHRYEYVESHHDHIAINANFLSDPLSILTSAGIHVPSYVLLKDINSMTTAINHLGPQIAIKILSRQIIHKTDVGAVRLHVPKEHAQSAARDMIEHIHASLPEAPIDGVLCMDMVDTAEGIECIVGIKKEAGLGTLLMLGMGGIFVEIMKDVSFRFVPLTHGDAVDLIDGLKSSDMFNGFRGNPAYDRKALIEALLSVSQLSRDHPDITQLDINPLLVLPEGRGVTALDCRMTIGE